MPVGASPLHSGCGGIRATLYTQVGEFSDWRGEIPLAWLWRIRSSPDTQVGEVSCL